jgi:hypothetical protein
MHACMPYLDTTTDDPTTPTSYLIINHHPPGPQPNPTQRSRSNHTFPSPQNVYDELLDTNGTPSLPELPAELYSISAAQVRPDACFVYMYVLYGHVCVFDMYPPTCDATTTHTQRVSKPFHTTATQHPNHNPNACNQPTQVMRPIDSLPYLTLHSTFADAEELLNRCAGSEWLIPVVDTKARRSLSLSRSLSRSLGHGWVGGGCLLVVCGEACVSVSLSVVGGPCCRR